MGVWCLGGVFSLGFGGSELGGIGCDVGKYF